MTPPTAMPSRWQIDVLVYEETSSYPVLLLQPGGRADHRWLHRLLTGAGLAVATAWEWERGLWPLAAGCEVAVSEGPCAVTVHVGGHCLTVGLRLTEPPLPWIHAAFRQRQVLFALLPPGPHPGDGTLIVDDVSTLGFPAGPCRPLTGTIPLAPGGR